MGPPEIQLSDASAHAPTKFYHAPASAGDPVAYGEDGRTKEVPQMRADPAAQQRAGEMVGLR